MGHTGPCSDKGALPNIYFRNDDSAGSDKRIITNSHVAVKGHARREEHIASDQIVMADNGVIKGHAKITHLRHGVNDHLMLDDATLA